jgi:ribosome biogenesis GTPase
MSHASVDPGALTAYGWSERVATLYRSLPDRPPSEPGRVTRVERGAMLVVDASGTERSFPSNDSPAVGDWVVIRGSRLSERLPRWSSLDRQDPDAGVQTLAANIDVVLVTVPADRASSTRAERELLMAWESGARPAVVLTKIDLAPDGLEEALGTRLIGVEVIATSTETGQGVDEVRSLLSPDRTGVLLGPTGAGKSSLTNALMGEDRQIIGEVRSEDRRGRHTTSNRQLLPLPGGGVVVDTPGVRSLGLLAVDRLDRVFPDVEELAVACRFADCAHTSEPGCAVLAAVGDGALSAERLASYRKLGRETAAEALRGDPLARRQVKRVWKQRTLDARRYDKRRRRDG